MTYGGGSAQSVPPDGYTCPWRGVRAPRKHTGKQMGVTCRLLLTSNMQPNDVLKCLWAAGLPVPDKNAYLLMLFLLGLPPAIII